ncbi:helix-turn-helix domain-containing protein [Streptomyces sp. HB132]|uniref:helix-turn-helix domain-containing protein n=1 Tax=Streptomyces sp. HB132 TaxID=767388 RepID=UPI0035A8B3CB
MSYSEGGGLTVERRAFRDEVRLQAGQRFSAGAKASAIAEGSRVGVRSVERWRRAWREGGMKGLRLLKGGRKSCSWQDCRDLLVRGAHSARRTDRGGLGEPQHPYAGGLKRHEDEHGWLTTAGFRRSTRPESRRSCLVTRAQSHGRQPPHHTRRPRPQVPQ